MPRLRRQVAQLEERPAKKDEVLGEALVLGSTSGHPEALASAACYVALRSVVVATAGLAPASR